jgi:hypothetical protein
MEPFIKTGFAVLRFDAECAINGAEVSVNAAAGCETLNDLVDSKLIYVNLECVRKTMTALYK